MTAAFPTSFVEINGPFTFTGKLTLLNRGVACQVAVVALGADKRDTISRALECQALPGAMPVQLVRPTNGVLTYVLDAESAAGLSTAVWDDWKKWPRSDLPKKK